MDIFQFVLINSFKFQFFFNMYWHDIWSELFFIHHLPRVYHQGHMAVKISGKLPQFSDDVILNIKLIEIAIISGTNHKL